MKRILFYWSLWRQSEGLSVAILVGREGSSQSGASVDTRQVGVVRFASCQTDSNQRRIVLGSLSNYLAEQLEEVRVSDIRINRIDVSSSGDPDRSVIHNLAIVAVMKS